MTWLCPGAISLIGALPTRGGQRYELRPLAGVDTLAAHYTGDPDPAGSVLGYGNVTPANTARYQVTKSEGDLFPEIAYHFIIAAEGTLYQCLDIAKRSWHVGAANTRAVGVLLTGFGRKGRPTAIQLATLAHLYDSLQNHLGHTITLAGHKALWPTDCPGDLADVWLAEVATLPKHPTMDLRQLREHVSALDGLAKRMASDAGEVADRAKAIWEAFGLGSVQ